MATPKTGRPVGRPKQKGPSTAGGAVYLSLQARDAVKALGISLAATLGGRWSVSRVVEWMVLQVEPPKPRKQG